MASSADLTCHYSIKRISLGCMVRSLLMVRRQALSPIAPRHRAWAPPFRNIRYNTSYLNSLPSQIATRIALGCEHEVKDHTNPTLAVIRPVHCVYNVSGRKRSTKQTSKVGTTNIHHFTQNACAPFLRGPRNHQRPTKINHCIPNSFHKSHHHKLIDKKTMPSP